MSYSSQILGTGAFLPEKLLTNRDLERLVDTSDNWIVERTGISSRHISGEKEWATDLAAIAARRALQSAGISPRDVDGIIFASVTPDQVMPSAACVLQAKLECRPVMAFDLSAACSGFLYSLSVADSLIRSGQLQKILVVGAETLSRIVDYKDRETCILFGDGAGAMVLGRAESTHSDRAPNSTGGKFLSFHLAADGNHGDLLSLSNPLVARSPFVESPEAPPMPRVRMKGREIFKLAVTALGERCREALAANELGIDQVDWFIPHQANSRIVEYVGEHLGIARERTIMNLASVGNTSSASIPIAFDEAVRDGRITRGQTILLAAFGAGLTSASTLLRY